VNVHVILNEAQLSEKSPRLIIEGKSSLGHRTTNNSLWIVWVHAIFGLVIWVYFIPPDSCHSRNTGSAAQRSFPFSPEKIGLLNPNIREFLMVLGR
jgi:hypothetical protein